MDDVTLEFTTEEAENLLEVVNELIERDSGTTLEQMRKLKDLRDRLADGLDDEDERVVRQANDDPYLKQVMDGDL